MCYKELACLFENSSLLYSKLPISSIDPTHVLLLTENSTTNTLGLTWHPSSDSFRFILKSWDPPIRMTKRTLLSDMNKVYDPVGFLSLVLIKGKIFLQQL